MGSGGIKDGEPDTSGIPGTARGVVADDAEGDPPSGVGATFTADTAGCAADALGVKPAEDGAVRTMDIPDLAEAPLSPLANESVPADLGRCWR